MIIKNGDLIKVTEGIIVHQVNCQGVMGKGVAKALKDKYPEVFTGYMSIFDNLKANGPTKLDLLGKTQELPQTDKLSIVNMFSQFDFAKSFYITDSKVYTNYDAFRKGLDYIMKHADGKSIHIPYRIGCGLANGDWDHIVQIILDLEDKYGIQVTAHKLH